MNRIIINRMHQQGRIEQRTSPHISGLDGFNLGLWIVFRSILTILLYFKPLWGWIMFFVTFLIQIWDWKNDSINPCTSSLSNLHTTPYKSKPTITLWSHHCVEVCICLKNANVLPCSMHKLRVLVMDAMDHNGNKISAELYALPD